VCDVLVPTSQCPVSRGWIGLRRDETDTTAPFKWQLPGGEEQELTYTNWFPGAPNNLEGRNEACVFAGPNHLDPGAYIWDDDVCTAVYCGVCEIDM